MSEYRNFTLHEAKSGHIFDKIQWIMNGRKPNISGNDLICRFEFGLRDHKRVIFCPKILKLQIFHL